MRIWLKNQSPVTELFKVEGQMMVSAAVSWVGGVSNWQIWPNAYLLWYLVVLANYINKYPAIFLGK